MTLTRFKWALIPALAFILQSSTSWAQNEIGAYSTSFGFSFS